MARKKVGMYTRYAWQHNLGLDLSSYRKWAAVSRVCWAHPPPLQPALQGLCSSLYYVVTGSVSTWRRPAAYHTAATGAVWPTGGVSNTQKVLSSRITNWCCPVEFHTAVKVGVAVWCWNHWQIGGIWRFCNENEPRHQRWTELCRTSIYHYRISDRTR